MSEEKRDVSSRGGQVHVSQLSHAQWPNFSLFALCQKGVWESLRNIEKWCLCARNLSWLNNRRCSSKNLQLLELLCPIVFKDKVDPLAFISLCYSFFSSSILTIILFALLHSADFHNVAKIFFNDQWNKSYYCMKPMKGRKYLHEIAW